MSKKQSPKRKLNKKKLKELILYLLCAVRAFDKKRHRQQEGLTQKDLGIYLLYYDMEHFRDYGSSITGATYIAGPDGPELKGLGEVLAEMELEGMLSASQGTGKKRPKARKKNA